MSLWVQHRTYTNTPEKGYFVQLNEFLAGESGKYVIAVQHLNDLFESSEDVIAGKPAGARYMLTFRDPEPA